MGKLGKCPLMAALVTLVSLGNPVDVPDGQAGKRQDRAKSRKKDILSDFEVTSKGQCGSGQGIRFISVQLTAHLQTGQLAIYPSRQPRPKLSSAGELCARVLYICDSVKCTKFAARE